MTDHARLSAGSARELAEELREYTAMKYAGNCKCGKCQLVPRALVERIYHTLNGSTFSAAQAAVVSLDKSKLDAAYEAYWANSSGTYTSIEAAILSYLNAAQPPAAPVETDVSEAIDRLQARYNDLSELQDHTGTIPLWDALNDVGGALDLLRRIASQPPAYLRDALQAQLDVSLMLMTRLGYDEQAKADCTAQARNALAGTPGAVAGPLSRSSAANVDDPADLWDMYCAETPRKSRSPQGAMAFAFSVLTSNGPQAMPVSADRQRCREKLQAEYNDLLALQDQVDQIPLSKAMDIAELGLSFIDTDDRPQTSPDSMREALDNSQSLLVMVLHLGEEYAMLSSRDVSNISKEDWAREGLTKLLTEQIAENRRTLSLSRPEHSPGE